MFGPDSNVLVLSVRPACLIQPSPSATNIWAAPMTGMKPTRSGCWAWAETRVASVTVAAVRAASMVVTTRIAILSKYRENRRQIPLSDTLGPSPYFELDERNWLSQEALME